MAGKKGPRGRRSPCPQWWVDEANRRLAARGITKRQLARALQAKGYSISETMVVRCLLEDERTRVPTIEAIEAISDALGLPRPVVVAGSMEQARELEAAMKFSVADADLLALAAELGDHGHDGATSTGKTSALGAGRSRTSGSRSKAVRRAARAS